MLSSIVPQAEYAEDQEAAKTILWAHVLYRGLQTGAVIGAGAGLGRALILRRKGLLTGTIQKAVLSATGTGAVVTTGLVVVGLPFRMRGREDIEWKDRSYRLLGNKYQEQVDDWTLPTTLLGLGFGIVLARRTGGSWKVVAGSAGAGSIVGLAAMMVYRLAVQKESLETTKPAGPIPSPS